MNNFFILTGPMGSGKSTILEELREAGLKVVDEPARKILQEQRSANSDGVPEKDPKLFVELMLSRAIDSYGQNKNATGPVIFDRGIPDMIAYAELFKFDPAFVKNVISLYPYHKSVFMMPDWEEIYATDEERTMSYSQAKAFGARLKNIYENLGYDLIPVPKESPRKRAEFIQSRISGRT